MIRCTAEWLRLLADLVEDGEVEVGRVETRNSGVLLGTFQPGTFAMKEIVDDMEQVERERRARRRIR